MQRRVDLAKSAEKRSGSIFEIRPRNWSTTKPHTGIAVTLRFARHSSTDIGSTMEGHACTFLQHQGLRLVKRNYRCRRGEIDLIMLDSDTLVFVEVRYRQSSGFGTAAETVGARKQARLSAAASHYLSHCALQPPCRFDVIGIDGNQQIEWIKNAFFLD